MNRQNTLQICAVPSSDGTKTFVKKVSVGTIGKDARIVWFVRRAGVGRGEWVETPADEAQKLLGRRD
jgi:hypothetical protein